MPPRSEKPRLKEHATSAGMESCVSEVSDAVFTLLEGMHVIPVKCSAVQSRRLYYFHRAENGRRALFGSDSELKMFRGWEEGCAKE